MRRVNDRPLSLGRTIVILIVLVSLSLGLIGLSATNKLDGVENWLAGVFQPVEQTFSNAGQNVGNFFAAVRDSQQLKAENDGLRLENQSLQAENAQMQDLQRQNDELRQELGFQKLRPDLINLPASVIGHDPSGTTQTLLIDKGEAEGVRKDMAVLSPSGYLIGQISEVEAHRATVLLAIDASSNVPARVQRTNADGVLQGEWQVGGRLTLKHIKQSATTGEYVGKGDFVITSGAGGVVPSGIIIGQVASVNQLDIKQEQEADVYPPVDANTLDSLLVNVGTK
jgi:rod shape-determining protein MreC